MTEPPRTTRAVRSARLRYRPLVVLLAATAAGIVVDRAATITFGVEYATAVVAWCAWLAIARLGRPRLAAAALMLAAAAAGAAWHHACWRLFDADDLSTFAAIEPRAVLVEGTLYDAPRVIVQPSEFNPAKFETKTRFTIASHAVRDGGTWRRAVGWVDVQIDAPVENATAGDRVRILGRISRSPPPLNPGEFDFAAYYRAERKLCLLRSREPTAVTLVERSSPWNVTAQLSRWRRSGHERLLEFVPTEQAGFASALLLGYRDELQRHENRAFFRTGTIHVLSISGLHIGMLAVFLYAALRIGWLRRRTGLAIVMLVTVGYALVIDAEPPAVRAVLTVLLIATAALLLRRTLDGNVLAAAALAVLAQNPTDLFRAGPQLSFLAAIVLTRHVRRPPRADDDPLAELMQSRRSWWLRRVRNFALLVGDMLVVSTLIFFVATPLVAHQFHILSPIGLILTPLTALPVALALLSGFLTLTLGAIVTPLAPLLGCVCGWSLNLTQGIVNAAERVPHGWLQLPGPALWQVALFYALAAVWGASSPRTWTRRAFGLLAIVCCVWSLVPRHELPADVAVRTTFISVGHGLSVLVEEQGGPTWLYDCGRFGAAERGAQSIAGVLWSRGIVRLDFLVISHLDADHYNALPYLVEQFRIGRLIVSKPLSDSTDPAVAMIRDTAAAAGIEWHVVDDTQLLFDGVHRGIERSILHPPPQGVAGNDNAQSMVIDLRAEGRRVLLTGDLEEAGLQRLLERGRTHYDVILAPHHGSARSNPPGLAAWATPRWVVVSGDEDRRGVVRRAFESVGAIVLQTTVEGAITVDVGRDGSLTVTPFCAKVSPASR
jgi:competence protein ComEC